MAARRKFALVEVEVTPPESGAEGEIARARVSYDDTLTQRNTTLTADPVGEVQPQPPGGDRLGGSQGAGRLRQERHRRGQRQGGGTRGQRSQGRGCERNAQAGRGIAADGPNVRQHERSSAAVAMPAEAEKIEQDGLDNTTRKSYRADSAQTKNQQSSR